jgi:hypothetical protein
LANMVRISPVCRKLNSLRSSVGAPRRWKRAFSVRNPLSQGQSEVSRLSMLLNAECPWTKVRSRLSHVQTRQPNRIARRIRVRNFPPLLNPPERDGSIPPGRPCARLSCSRGRLEGVEAAHWTRCCKPSSTLCAQLYKKKTIGVCFWVFVFGHCWQCCGGCCCSN